MIVLCAHILRRMRGRAVEDAAWLRSVKDALVPVTVGLILASGFVMARAADHDVLSILISATTTLYITTIKRNSLWMLGTGTLAGLASVHLGPAG